MLVYSGPEMAEAQVAAGDAIQAAMPKLRRLRQNVREAKERNDSDFANYQNQVRGSIGSVLEQASKAVAVANKNSTHMYEATRKYAEDLGKSMFTLDGQRPRMNRIRAASAVLLAYCKANEEYFVGNTDKTVVPDGKSVTYLPIGEEKPVTVGDCKTALADWVLGGY